MARRACARAVLLAAVAVALLAAVPGARADSLGFQAAFYGQYSLSIDGTGFYNATEPTSILVRKPTPGLLGVATVHKAYLFWSATDGLSPLWPSVKLANRTINGTKTFVNHALGNFSFYSQAADVTSIVAPLLDPLTGSNVVAIPYAEPVLDSRIEGAILAVVFADPNVPVWDLRSITLLFGGQAPTGDTLKFRLAQPHNQTTDSILLSLGISFSKQPSVNQSSIISISNKQISSSAGGEDDTVGPAVDGALITVGGFNDNPALPPNASAGPDVNPTYDDELYDLRTVIASGATAFNITTSNPSEDDNLFFASLSSGGLQTIVPANAEFVVNLSPAGRVALNSNTPQTVTATVVNGTGAPVANKNVTFTVLVASANGVVVSTRTLKVATDAAGKASIILSQDAGTIAAVFASVVDSAGRTIFSLGTAVLVWTTPDDIAITVWPAAQTAYLKGHAIFKVSVRLLATDQPLANAVVAFAHKGPPAEAAIVTEVYTTGADGIAEIRLPAPAGTGTTIAWASTTYKGWTYSSNAVQALWLESPHDDDDDEGEGEGEGDHNGEGHHGKKHKRHHRKYGYGYAQLADGLGDEALQAPVAPLAGDVEPGTEGSLAARPPVDPSEVAAARSGDGALSA